MPKVKIPRKNISMDMTAMCDMAFLLLTFFMLATQFKEDEAVAVDMPSSVSEIVLPDTDMLIISAGKDGGVFFGIDGQNTRIAMLDKMSARHKVEFTDQEKKTFSLLPSFGAPIGAMKAILNLSSDERNKAQTGIPVDSLNNQLYDWILFARKSNSKFRVAIRADKDTDYSIVEKIISTLQEQNINKINLITNLEEGAE